MTLSGINPWDRSNQARNEPTGFENRTDATVSKVDGTRTLTVTPSSTEFQVWVSGTRHTKGAAESVVWTDVEGLHYFYYASGGVLTHSTTYPNLNENALVASLYWRATATKASLYFTGQNELHGMVMDGLTHSYLHNTRGAEYASGLGLAGLTTDGGGGSNTHAQFGVSNGVIYDEDVQITITGGSPQTLADPAELPVWYLSGATPVWRKKTANTYPFIYAGEEGATGTRVPYNKDTGGTWSLAETAANKFLLLHVFATNDSSTPMMSIQGQAEYATKSAARAGSVSELGNLYTIGLPVEEFVPIGTLIIQTGAYANTPKAQFITTDAAATEDYIDWRQVQNPSGSTGLDAHALGGALHTSATLAELNALISGATVPALAGINQWTGTQYAEITTVTSSSAEVDIDAEASNLFYHDLTEDTEVQNPTNLVAGMAWRMILEADGTHEATWDTYYNWGTGTEPDMSAMSNGDYVIIDFLAKSSTAIACAVSETY